MIDTLKVGFHQHRLFKTNHINEFMQVYQLLISKLALRKIQFKKEAIEISLFMSMICYKYFHPEIWEILVDLKEGSRPEMIIVEKFMTKALSERLLLDQRSVEFYQSTLLDDIKIPRIENFPETMKPGKFFSDSKSTFSKEEN